MKFTRLNLMTLAYQSAYFLVFVVCVIIFSLHSFVISLNDILGEFILSLLCKLVYNFLCTPDTFLECDLMNNGYDHIFKV